MQHVYFIIIIIIIIIINVMHKAQFRKSIKCAKSTVNL